MKNEQKIPMIHVVAKPWIGPVPKASRMTPVINEVKLESKVRIPRVKNTLMTSAQLAIIPGMRLYIITM